MNAVLDFIAAGGFVMWPLTIAAAILWYALGWRVYTLGQTAKDCSREDVTRFSALIRTIVMVAPLAGLLGTVGGMIETFDALGDMSLFTQSGGIAGGIAQALISTQMGLAVAIPGLVVGRLLERRAERLLALVEA